MNIAGKIGLLILMFWGSLALGQDSTMSWKELNKRGEEAFYKGKYKDALKVFKIAKSKAEKEFGEKHQYYIETCNSIAFSYRKLGLYSDAEVFQKKVKSIKEGIHGKNHPEYAVACNNLALLYFNWGKYSNAELLYKEAKNIQEEVLGKKHLDYASTCNNFATLCERQGKYAFAEKLFKIAKNIRKESLGKKSIGYINICNNLGLLYLKKGAYQKAEKLQLEVMKFRKKVFGKNHPSYTIACNNLGNNYFLQGNYEKARVLHEDIKRIRLNTLGKSHPLYATSCNNLALIYRFQGLLEKAKKLSIEALKIRKKNLGIYHSDYAISCNNLAGIYRVLGQYSKAELLYLEALNVFGKVFGKDHPQYALNCNNLAALYKNQGLFDKAKKWYVKASKIQKRILGEQHAKYIISCNNLALLYTEQGNFKDAENLYKKVIATQKVIGTETYAYARYCNNLAFLYFMMKAYGNAEEYYLRALKTQKRNLGKTHLNYALFCNNLATLYLRIGKYKKAKRFYKTAKKIRKKLLKKTHPNYLVSCSNLASLYVQQCKFIEAEKLFLEGFENINQLLKNYLFFLSELEREKFVQVNITKHLNAYYSFVERSYTTKNKAALSQMYNNHLLIKSLLFNSTQKTKQRIYTRKDTALINLYEKFIAKRVQCNKALELTKEQRKKRGINLSKLAEEVDNLEKNIARKSTEFAKVLEEYQPHTWKEVKQALKPKEVAIELIRFHWNNKQWTDTVHYAALIVTPKSRYPEPVFLKNGNALEGKAFQNYQKLLKLKSGDQLSYQQFWQPIQERLKAIYPKVKKIYVSLDGVYHQINLQTLQNPATGKYLNEELNIQLVSNTKDLLDRSAQKQMGKSPTRVYLFGYPDYTQYNPEPLSQGSTKAPNYYNPPLSQGQKKALRSWFQGDKIPALSGTQKEVLNIQKNLSKQVSCTVFQKANATEENIKALTNPTVLHLATHSYFLQTKELDRLKKQRQLQIASTEIKQYVENPLLRSGLLWAGAQQSFKGVIRPKNVTENGILTAQEVLNMNLDSTQLVVLSACETGRGKIQNGEGVYGLQRAFLSAGAQYVLMSLWKVDDVATQYFMQYFYESWAKDQNVRKAYRFAQDKLRQDYPSPYYWGAFVLVSR